MRLEGVTVAGQTLVVVVSSRRNVYGEWVTRFTLDGVHHPEMDSFSGDRADAHATALMCFREMCGTNP